MALTRGSRRHNPQSAGATATLSVRANLWHAKVTLLDRRAIKVTLALVVVNLDQFASEIARLADIFFEQPELVSGEWHIAVKQAVKP